MNKLCGFEPPEGRFWRGGVPLEEFEQNPKTNLFQRVFRLTPPSLENPPNAVSQAYMFKPTPKIVRWYVTKAEGLTVDQVRYMFGLATYDWKQLPIQFREASSASEATIHLQSTYDKICGADQAIGCYSWESSSSIPLLQVKTQLYKPEAPLMWLECAVHEFGHHMGLNDGYMENPCGGGGQNYMGAMGFGEGLYDRLGSRPSIHERSVIKRSAILRSYPRCQ